MSKVPWVQKIANDLWSAASALLSSTLTAPFDLSIDAAVWLSQCNRVYEWSVDDPFPLIVNEIPKKSRKLVWITGQLCCTTSDQRVVVVELTKGWST